MNQYLIFGKDGYFQSLRWCYHFMQRLTGDIAVLVEKRALKDDARNSPRG